MLTVPIRWIVSADWQEPGRPAWVCYDVWAADWFRRFDPVPAKRSKHAYPRRR